jgi:hypothetical protein
MIQQAKTIDQPDQTKVMIAMEMRDEDVRDPASPDPVLYHLDLRSFPTIDQKIISVHRYHLAGRVTVKRRNGRVISKDSDSEHDQ